MDNAHHILNHSDAPLSYLVVGSQAAVDAVRYPDEGQTLYHQPPRWWVTADDGTILREGQT